MKKLLLMLLPLLFINCSSDDKDITPNQNSLVGSWKALKSEAIIEGNNLSNETKQLINNQMDPDIGYTYITFYSNGTGVGEDLRENSVENFTYTVQGNILSIVYAGDIDEDDSIITFKINGNQLFINDTSPSVLKNYQKLFPDAGLTKTDYLATYERM
ncbi:lipocalin family protein [Apibacter sp. HY039]|uniref:lipocalin family protein n=1 Tax=Apibacter sp. HY039 TaxID=2501476 RepID=UPI0013E38F61|nr:lipocalin family protein [Apibacter sp. HY039]